MRTHIVLFLIATILAFAGFKCSRKLNKLNLKKKQDILAGTIQGLKIDNIMTSKLELVENTEVVVSHVEIPANTTLPKHCHPGEEFVYVLEGSAILWQKDKSEVDFWNNLPAQRRFKGFVASHLLTAFKGNKELFKKRIALSQKIIELAFHLYDGSG